MTLKLLQSKLDTLNSLCDTDFHLFNYMRAYLPYGLMTTDGQEIMRGTKNDIYLYLDGAITGIMTYRKSKNL